MKSIMQEASSVMKAIEKGWESAGKPKEFSIKVFEESKKNFIGMTIQSAKVGIFFDEKYSAPKEIEKVPVAKKKEYVPKPQHVPKKEHPQVRPEKSEFTKQAPKPLAKQVVKDGEKQQKIVWTPEMLDIARTWLTQTLSHMARQDVTFTLDTSHYQLLINFNKPLLESPEKEQQLLRSFSLLLIQTLRHALKRPLRGFKIMMNSKYVTNN